MASSGGDTYSRLDSAWAFATSHNHPFFPQGHDPGRGRDPLPGERQEAFHVWG